MLTLTQIIVFGFEQSIDFNSTPVQFVIREHNYIYNNFLFILAMFETMFLTCLFLMLFSLVKNISLAFKKKAKVKIASKHS